MTTKKGEKILKKLVSEFIISAIGDKISEIYDDACIIEEELASKATNNITSEELKEIFINEIKRYANDSKKIHQDADHFAEVWINHKENAEDMLTLVNNFFQPDIVRPRWQTTKKLQ